LKGAPTFVGIKSGRWRWVEDPEEFRDRNFLKVSIFFLQISFPKLFSTHEVKILLKILEHPFAGFYHETLINAYKQIEEKF